MFPKSAAGFSTFCHVCVVFKTHGRATSDTKCVLIFVILVSLGRTRGRQVTLEMRAETLRDFVLFPRCRSILTIFRMRQQILLNNHAGTQKESRFRNVRCARPQKINVCQWKWHNLLRPEISGQGEGDRPVPS